MKKIALLVVVVGVIALAGYYVQTRQSNEAVPVAVEVDTTKSYSNGLFSVEYPNEYTVSEDGAGITTISNDEGKIMIGDFEPAVGVGPAVEMTQEQLDGLPKGTVYHGYDSKAASALFYKTGDDETAAELKKIQDSIKLK